MASFEEAAEALEQLLLPGTSGDEVPRKGRCPGMEGCLVGEGKTGGFMVVKWWFNDLTKVLFHRIFMGLKGKQM